MSPENKQVAINKGPTGFITDGQNMFVVEDGSIFKDGQLVGTLFEDGYLQSQDQALGKLGISIAIDTLPSMQFRGIDAKGLEINLPDVGGPSGKLNYNGLNFGVLNGRIINDAHEYLGCLSADGSISVRDKAGQNGRFSLNENALLNFSFDGQKFGGQDCHFEFNKPLYKVDRTYTENEIIRYFAGFDALNALQKKYLLETMAFWSACGVLQVVRRSEGDASLGNVKHGATGVTRIRTGNVTLDKEEFEREVNFFKKYGPIMNVSRTNKGHLEVRLNMVVAHEFGHQIDFVINSTVQDQVFDLYEKRKKSCDRLHPGPDGENHTELLLPQQLEQRHFISGYAKSSPHEYWAESLAAFTLKETRKYLKSVDPAMFEILTKLVSDPTAIFSRVLLENLLALQASLKLGGEFNDGIWSSY